MPKKSKPCHCCEGSGEEADQTLIGFQWSMRRLDAGIGLRALARAMDISHTYLSHLEGGTRRWTKQTQHDYKSKLAELSAKSK